MRLFNLFCILLFSFIFPQLTQAITISAVPNPAVTNQQVKVTITANFPVPDICSLQVNFDDGSGWQPAGNCNNIANCTKTVTHSYSSVNDYQIQARSNPTVCNAPPSGANPASYILRVAISLQAGEELPIGIAGIRYKHQLTTRGANGAVRFQLASGRLPPGLRLSPGGQIWGVPTIADHYAFRLKISDQNGQSIVQDYLLIIEQAALKVTVTPDQHALARNREGTYNLKYTFTSTEPLDDTLRSQQGIFYADNRRLGVSNTNMVVTMRRGRAQASETVTVPLSILQTVQRLGLGQIRYERIFTADYMKAQATSSTVIPVGTGFTITQVRIYFGNNQGKTTVKRNQRDIEAHVDIRYEGAGSLEGFWEADGRILAAVRKKLQYSRDRTITLDLPRIPPLPTFSFGSHRLRFVINKPRMNITFPEAIYMVSREGLAEQYPILLDSPADNTRLNHSELQFNWQKKRGISTYLVEFFTTKDEPPIFSAYTKVESYTVPKVLLDKHFKKQGNYWWMVSGYNAEGEIAAQSRVFSFTLFDDAMTNDDSK